MSETFSWEARAAALELLALSLRHPKKLLAEAIYSGEWLEAALEISEALDLSLPDDFGGEDLATNPRRTDFDAESLRHVLAAESTRLFASVPEAVISPYEGIWRAADDGVRGLLFVNPHSTAVERFFRSCGLGRPEGTNEPLDHVATELEFLKSLCALETGLVSADTLIVPADELPGGSPHAAYERFMEEHARTWIPRFAAELEEESRLPFYRCVGQLLAAYLAQ